MKKQSNLSRLLDYAGTYRILTYLSWVLAAASALLALAPFGYIWRIATAISCSTMWGLPIRAAKRC